MNKSIVLLSAFAAATLAGAAIAQEGPGGPMGRDTDGDGYISRAEVSASAQQNFDRLDTNGDGIVSFEEFEAISLSKFDQTDTNADGLLSREELQAARPERGEGGRRGRRRG